MRNKTERFNFSFDLRTSELIKKIAEKTDVNYTKLVQRAIEAYAKEKGVEV